MPRVYNNLRRGEGGGGVDLRERERPAAVIHSPHQDRDATIERRDLHEEFDASLFLNPRSLRAPTPRPGMIQRWVRDGFGMEGQDKLREEQHYLNKIRQGWTPRAPETISEGERRFYMTTRSGSADDLIRVAGLVLMEMPVHIAQQRFQALNDINKRQAETLPQSTEEARRRASALPGIGDLEIENQQTSYTGRKPATMAD